MRGIEPTRRRSPKGGTAADPALARLLAPYPSGVRRLLRAGRQRIRELVPSAAEKVRPGWGLLGFSAPRYFAFLAPMADEVRLGFERGVLLDDPWGVLRGTGSTVRWISLRRPEDLTGAAVTALVLQAAELAPESPNQLRARPSSP